MNQLVFTEWDEVQTAAMLSPLQRLTTLLTADLDFHDQPSDQLTHNLHPFPAKFPPQLPRLFIQNLTLPGEVVLDPMSGSGTTVVEAVRAGRLAVGTDIDPLALTLSLVKTTVLSLTALEQAAAMVTDRAQMLLRDQTVELEAALNSLDPKNFDFIRYWFLPQTQQELIALKLAIQQVSEPALRRFLWTVFSSTIIAKSGGVSLARDLAHTRPHRVMDKFIPSALEIFRARFAKSLKSLAGMRPDSQPARIIAADAQRIPLPAHSVDLIVTSPPYASNAIDYMRAHKFSLVWLGYPLEFLSQRRGEYIGGETVRRQWLVDLPPQSRQIVELVAAQQSHKGLALHRYYSEMTRCLSEMFRVLKSGKSAIVVVGSSTLAGVDTQTHECLAEIGARVGFTVAGIGVRRIDRDRRMMPARRGKKSASMIEQRMHEEYVIGFYKPESVDEVISWT